MSIGWLRESPDDLPLTLEINYMHISQETPDQPDVIALIADLDAYQDTLYPAEARYALDLESLKKSNVIFVVARDIERTAVACGAVVMENAIGELKRVYVRPENRGQGIAREVLVELEAMSLKNGCNELLLETGPYSTEALAFYHKLGYRRRGPFGSYPDHPLSVFMEKTLHGAVASDGSDRLRPGTD